MNRGGTVKDKDIHIGDIVRVRQWDDMLNEFGVDEHKKIKSLARFSEQCKYLCGRQLTVMNIVGVGLETRYFAIVDGEDNCTYVFSSDELEPLFDEDCEVANDEEIKLLFE